MKITVNGTPRETGAATLAALLEELGHGGAKVATAVNEGFVPAAQRAVRIRMHRLLVVVGVGRRHCHRAVLATMGRGAPSGATGEVIPRALGDRG